MHRGAIMESDSLGEGRRPTLSVGDSQRPHPPLRGTFSLREKAKGRPLFLLEWSNRLFSCDNPPFANLGSMDRVANPPGATRSVGV